MEWLSILPPIVAIIVVIWKKEVILALLLSVFCAEFLLTFNNNTSVLSSPINSIERIIATIGDSGNARILLFSLLVGALLAFIRDSGGVAATVNKLVASGIASHINSLKRLGGICIGTIEYL